MESGDVCQYFMRPQKYVFQSTWWRHH